MAPSEEEKSHTNGALEITKSVNRLESLLTDSKPAAPVFAMAVSCASRLSRNR